MRGSRELPYSIEKIVLRIPVFTCEQTEVDTANVVRT
jgi:hypothetical protein